MQWVNTLPNLIRLTVFQLDRHQQKQLDPPMVHQKWLERDERNQEHQWEFVVCIINGYSHTIPYTHKHIHLNRSLDSNWLNKEANLELFVE